MSSHGSLPGSAVSLSLQAALAREVIQEKVAVRRHASRAVRVRRPAGPVRPGPPGD